MLQSIPSYATGGARPARAQRAAVNYIDTVRLAAVRAALLTKPQVALRLLLAQLIAGAQHFTVKPEPMPPASGEIAGALQDLSALGVSTRRAPKLSTFSDTTDTIA